MVEKLLTPEARASYAYLFTPQSNKKDDGTIEKKYSIVAIFPKDTDLSALKAAAQASLVEKWGADQSKWPTITRNPFRKCRERWKNVDGKQVIPPGYEDGDAVFMTFTAKEDRKPGVVDANVKDIIEPREFYSGCYFRASVRPYTYDNKGNRGVAFGLNNVQKLRDGEPLGGGPARPTDEFTAVAGETGGTSGAASVFD